MAMSMGRLRGHIVGIQRGLGADASGWTTFTPAAFPGTPKLNAATAAAKPSVAFPKTSAALSQGITLPAPIKISVSGQQYQWSPLKEFPSLSIPEVASLQNTIIDESKKVATQISYTNSIIEGMLSEKFESIPGWNLGKGPEIVDKIVKNFNKANKIFGAAQTALRSGVTATKYTVDAAGKISMATSGVLQVLPGRIKDITNNIGATINQNAQTLVNDIGRISTTGAQDMANQISNGVSTYMNQLSGNMKTFYTNLSSAMSSDLGDVIKQVNNYVSGISMAVSADFNGMANWFRSNLDDLQRNIQVNAKALGDRITADAMAKINQFQADISKAKTDMVNTLNEKVAFVQSQVDASLATAKADMTKLSDDTKVQINASLEATKKELNKSVADVTATVNDIKKQIDATAATVGEQAKVVDAATSDIRKVGDQVSAQAKQVEVATAEIQKIGDEMKKMQNRLDELTGKVKAGEEKKPFSFFGRNKPIPFLGVLSGEGLGAAIGKMVTLLGKRKRGSASEVSIELGNNLSIN